jgi:4'-phosphopantetheinyl transferase
VSATESAAYFALLDASERQRAARFHFARDRDAFIASHGWLRTLLGQYLQTDPQSLEFTVGDRGKPAIHGAAIQFNLSHSGAMAACAVTQDRPVGIDIERIRPMPELESIARRVLQPEECRQLLELGAEERLAAFFRCWTRREAYVKALGAGLMESQPPAADWSLIDLDASPDYAGAVAIRGSHWTVLSRRG